MLAQPFAPLPEHIRPSALERLDAKNPLFKWLKQHGFTGAQIKRSHGFKSHQDLVPFITHTSLAAQLCKHSSICVPTDLVNEFYRRYNQAYLQGFPLYIVEKVDRARPRILFFDLDFLWMPHNLAVEPRYEAFLDDLVPAVVEWAGLAFDAQAALPDESAVSSSQHALNVLGDGTAKPPPIAYALTSTQTPVSKDGATMFKHGLHLFFPFILVDEENVMLLRRHLVHQLKSTFPTQRVRHEYNVHLVDELYEKIVDLSVCKTSQIRLPGSRKIGLCRPCECTPNDECTHERVVYVDHTKKRVERFFNETRRAYSVRDALEFPLADSGNRWGAPRKLEQTFVDRLNSPHNLHVLCQTLSVLRPPSVGPDARDEPTPLLLVDADVPDTLDDDRRSRSISNPHRYRRRRSETALPDLADDEAHDDHLNARFLSIISSTPLEPLDTPENAANVARESNAANAPNAPAAPNAAPQKVPRTTYRELFMRWAAAFFPRDFEALNVEKYIEHVDQSRGTHPKNHKLERAMCIVTESHCENKDSHPIHNNKACSLIYEPKRHRMLKRCFCKCPSALGRKFSSCQSFEASIDLPPLRHKTVLTQTQLNPGGPDTLPVNSQTNAQQARSERSERSDLAAERAAERQTPGARWVGQTGRR
jgi:hypothetical protein